MNTRLFDDIKKVSDGVGDKLGLAVQAVAQTFGGIIIGFVDVWVPESGIQISNACDVAAGEC